MKAAVNLTVLSYQCAFSVPYSAPCEYSKVFEERGMFS